MTCSCDATGCPIHDPEGHERAQRSYYDVIRDMTSDPEIRAAIDQTEAEERQPHE